MRCIYWHECSKTHNFLLKLFVMITVLLERNLLLCQVKPLAQNFISSLGPIADVSMHAIFTFMPMVDIPVHRKASWQPWLYT